MPYDDALFDATSLLPDRSFESVPEGPGVMAVARRGDRSLGLTNEPAGSGNGEHTSRPVTLTPGKGYVLGGFVRREAPPGGQVYLSLRRVPEGLDICRTPEIRQTEPVWELVWGCIAPPEGSRRFKMGMLVARGLGPGAVYVDDVFLCPVDALMPHAMKADAAGPDE